jgi:DNA primase
MFAYPLNLNVSANPQTDFVQLISAYVKLQEGRKVLKGNCPFHHDNAASFMVYPSKNIFKCFGCGLEGGPAEFSKAIESI